jgi:hypothetical protein
MCVPLAPAAKELGVGLRRPGAGAWRHDWGSGAHCSRTTRHAALNDQIFAGSLSKIIKLENLLWDKLVPVSHQSPVRTQNFTFSLAAKYAESPCSAAAFVVNSELHTGACPSVRLCAGLKTVAAKKDFGRLLGMIQEFLSTFESLYYPAIIAAALKIEHFFHLCFGFFSTHGPRRPTVR